MTGDPSGGWIYCNYCGRVVRVARDGTIRPHTIDPDMDDRCHGSGRLATT